MRVGRVVMIGVGLAVVAGTAPTAAAASAETAGAPPGYQVVISGPINAPPSTIVDSGGQVACPSGTVPWGGGVSIRSSDPTVASINTSAPSVSNGWEARVNNTGTATVQFEVLAVCAQKPSGYKIAFHSVVNPANTMTSTAARCPFGKVLLSGGLFSTSDSPSVQSPSAWPVSAAKFKAFMWNGSSTDESFTAYAICASKPPGYVLRSSGGPLAPGSASIEAAACPSRTSVLGGGVQLASPQAADEISASFPFPNGLQWSVGAYNGTAASQTETNYAICGA